MKKSKQVVYLVMDAVVLNTCEVYATRKDAMAAKKRHDKWQSDWEKRNKIKLGDLPALCLAKVVR